MKIMVDNNGAIHAAGYCDLEPSEGLAVVELVGEIPSDILTHYRFDGNGLQARETPVLPPKVQAAEEARATRRAWANDLLQRWSTLTEAERVEIQRIVFQRLFIDGQ